MNNSALKEWLKLSVEEKYFYINETAQKIGLPFQSVEKDWWVTHTLSVIFSMNCAKSIIFKGGTSLSKAWKIIERFSEDVDLALDREFLGFSGDLSKTQISKLRYASYKFLTEKFTPDLQQKFNELGFTDVLVK
jgi:predicted nucleotidyltransferase component of viral defense system